MSEVYSPSSIDGVIDWDAIVAKLGLKQPFPEPYWQGKSFQLVVRNHLIRAKRAILSMHKGLGKTSTILSIFEDPKVHKNIPGFAVVIVTTVRGMAAYERDIKMFPEWQGKIQLVLGDKRERELKWKTDAKYFIVSSGTLLDDIGVKATKKQKDRKDEVTTNVTAPDWLLKGRCDAVVFDEFHRYFRNRSSKFFAAAEKLFRNTEYVIPMSGSATSKGPQDLWPALNICDHKFWSSYWKYVSTWCEVEDTPFGKRVGDPRTDKDSHGVSRVDKWRDAIRPYVSHVTDVMVGDQLPPLNRNFMDVKLPTWQMNAHDQMRDQQFMETPDDEYIFSENSLVKVHKLRQMLICPKAVHPAWGIGEGLEAVYANAQESELTRYAIFTPFRPPILLFDEWLRAQGANVFWLAGGIGLEEQNRRLEMFDQSLRSATPERPSIVLSTIKYGESWEIPQVKHDYFIGEEWDPEENKQAEGRKRRLISDGPVFSWYCRFLGTYQEEIIDLLLRKSTNVRTMFRSWGQLKTLVNQHG